MDLVRQDGQLAGRPARSWYGDDAGTPLRTLANVSNLNALVAVSKGMWAVKLCSSKILQFLTEGAGLTQVVLYNGCKMLVEVVVVVVVVVVIK